MNNEAKLSRPARTGGEPEATNSPVPMAIVVLTLTLLFLGGVYFDYHSGWFNAKVYSPYVSVEQLDLYQPKSVAAATLAIGKAKYEQNCGICHGFDGLGKAGTAPPLAGSEWVVANGFHRLAVIPLEGLNGPIEVKGQQMTFPSGMVAIGTALSDADLAAVLTYIRSSWGNKAGAVTADDVKAIRAAVRGHPAITAAELKNLPE
jgi:mono/diheme cytochrome c family protein